MVTGTLGVLRHGKRIEEMTDVLARARKLGTRLVDDVARRRRYPFRDPLNRLITALIVRPQISRFIVQSQGGVMKHVYESLIQRALLHVESRTAAPAVGGPDR